MNYKSIFLYTIIALCFAASIFWVHHNYSFYERPIAKVNKTNLEDTTEMNDMYQNEDRLFTQRIIAQLKNGVEKGQLIHLTNEYSSSGAYDQVYLIGIELFVSIVLYRVENADFCGTIVDV